MRSAIVRPDVDLSSPAIVSNETGAAPRFGSARKSGTRLSSTMPMSRAAPWNDRDEAA
jgi:hypothetical protein